MKYRSTRKKSPEVDALGAIEKGLAEDGGLFVPVNFPQFAVDRLSFEFKEVAKIVLPKFFEGEALEREMPQICDEAFDFPAPLVPIDKHIFQLELFHGPTAAFKDFGARFLAGIFRETQKNVIVLVATSGDTGGAVASAFNEQKGIDVFVLFPEHGVSDRQKHQLTCWGSNVHSFAVKGTFDHCQSMAKKVFLEWKAKRSLTSANSINVGRLLPQVVCYASSSLEYFRKTNRVANVIIPTGNLGNAVAAMWAKKIGFPIGKITLACNANDVLRKYFEMGNWAPTDAKKTIANAMDVGNPSNMERVFDLFEDPRAKGSALDTHSVTDEEIRNTIAVVYKRWGRVICPHTATAYDYLLKGRFEEGIVVSTAHAAKFETVVEPIINKKIELPESLLSISSRPERYQVIIPDHKLLLAELSKFAN